MTTIKANFCASTTITTDPEYDNVTASGVGTLKSNFDDITGALTGISLTCTAGGLATSTTDNSVIAIDPFNAQSMSFYQFAGIGATSTNVLSGFDANESVQFTFAGHRDGQAARDTYLEINSTQYVYDNSGDGLNPTAPTVFTVNADASGEIVFTVGSTSGVQSYLSAMQLVYPIGPTLTTTESEYSPNDTATISTTDLSTLTTATITDGTNTANVTINSDTSLTFPPRTDLGQAVLFGTGLTLTVGDGTDTASTTIDYVPAAYYEYLTASGLIALTSKLPWHYMPDGSPITITDGWQLVTRTDSIFTYGVDGSMDYTVADLGESYTENYSVIDPSTGINYDIEKNYLAGVPVSVTIIRTSINISSLRIGI